MTLCSHGSQTGIRGGLPIGKIWQAERLPYNLFRVAPAMFFCCPDPGKRSAYARDTEFVGASLRLRGGHGIVGQAPRLPGGHEQSQGVQPKRPPYTEFLVRFRRQGLLLSESPFRQSARETQTGPEPVLSQGAGK